MGDRWYVSEWLLAERRAVELEHRLELVRLLKEGRPDRLTMRMRLPCSIAGALIGLGQAPQRQSSREQPAL
jgi:hypothetical protein